MPGYDKEALVLTGYGGTLSNIPEQKWKQGMVTKSQKSLAHQLLKAQEEERLRIARELHDEMGQALTALKIELQQIQREPIIVRARLEDSIAMVDQIVGHVHSLLTDLRPAPLEELGLAAALRWYVRRQAQRTGLTIEFDVDARLPRLSMEFEIGCFRIVQEAVTNAIKHAHAQHITITLRQENASLCLGIQDDGIGFDVIAAQQQAEAGGSFGLLGIQERAYLVGGQLHLTSSAREGTLIQVHFSLKDCWQSLPCGTEGLARAFIEKGTGGRVTDMLFE